MPRKEASGGVKGTEGSKLDRSYGEPLEVQAAAQAGLLLARLVGVLEPEGEFSLFDL